MLITLSGIVMLVRLVQFKKAESPILVTLSGIVMLVRLVQLQKAWVPMLVTGLPPIVFGITSSPAGVSSQSVIVTFPPAVV